MKNFNYDVAIIGACGHVGLPLSLVLANEGLKVLGLDINEESINKIKKKIMPFLEEGSQELLNKVIDNTFFLSLDHNKISECENIIIIIGTPIDSDFTVDLSKLINLIKNLMPNLKENQLIILRSTLAPKTTDYIKNFIENNSNFKIGKNLFLATVPERLTQNNSIKELKELSNVIGVYDDISFEKVKNLFTKLHPGVTRVTPLEAELTKLFNNSYRAANFALANEYFIIAETLGANFYKIREAMNNGYSRSNVPKPGFTKGPCLGKDSWILLNAMPHFNLSTTMISAAYKINEGLPLFLVQKLKEKVNITNKNIAILGLTFKKDSDDLRDSLSLKLVNLFKNEFVTIITHDPFVDNKNINSVLSDADIVILATNHTYYENLDFKNLVKENCLFVDLWDVLKTSLFIFNKDKLLEKK
ncbi:nucleotide sugar dehydrogenase [Candidatus Woesearchaeota archaeon]|nr:nucleotide sugar dehydrogenase [Candidatus Woesearchaeota archaeon]